MRLAVEQIFTSARTLGMRVEPPTNTTSSICSGLRRASFKACLLGPTVYDWRWAGIKLLELVMRDLAPVVFAAREFDVELTEGLDDNVILASTTPADRLHRFGVTTEVDTEVAANIIEGDRDQQVVNVVATEMRVAVGGDDLEDSVVQFQDRDVEGAAAQIVDCDDSILLVEAVGERRGGRLVDQTKHFETGDAAGVFVACAARR